MADAYVNPNGHIFADTSSYLGDLSSMDIETAMLVATLKQVDQLELQIKMQLKKIQIAHELLVTKNKQLDAMIDKGVNFNEESAEEKTLKSEISALNNMLQTDMILLQSLGDKRSAAFERATALVKRFGDIASSISRNF